MERLQALNPGLVVLSITAFGHDGPAGRIRTLDQVYEWGQTRSQGLLIEVDHPSLGRVQLPGPPLRFDGSAKVRHRPPPTLGQHTGEVLRWLEGS